MGKFDGILFCTDLDDTLLTKDKHVSKENREAIDYFIKQGGSFTFATGRIPYGARLMLDFVTINAPMVCMNGAGIYDAHKEELLWSLTLPPDAIKVVEWVDKTFPFAGIEVCAGENVYFCKSNRVVEEHKQHERLPDLYMDYHDFREDWYKTLFLQEADELPALKQAILSSGFAHQYTFVQSSPNYYEILPRGASKGNALAHLARMLKIPMERVIAIGDNENDLEMVEVAGLGVAVANAIAPLRDAADYITVDHESHAIAAIISALDSGRISF